MNLKIKTFKEHSTEELDKEVNRFGDSHEVRATQTHVTFAMDRLVYHAVVFYVPEK